MTTENHVFVFMNLCQENRLVDAERYLNQHPEIATDPKAINHGPALVAVAIFVEDPQAVDLLLEHGADINATDIGGQTALEMAILKWQAPRRQKTYRPRRKAGTHISRRGP
jgi:ankyrin repeat protein